MIKAGDYIDAAAADVAATRIVLAYEIGDAMSDFADEQPELMASALTVAQIVTCFGLLQIGMPEKEAVSAFAKVFRAVRRRTKKVGANARLSDVLTEMHLDQRPERKR